ncbi:O-acetyl-ADP-ribose deacetylase [Vibrio sp.]|uniref:O-acetyl-ADP-ribose deacetylase n=1 Tax=Vibrio sp. TaxID=678 RepID=UPI003D09819D
MSIHLHQGDITTATVDAIVNAANPTLLGGGGVDGAIHRVAGSELLRACQALPDVRGVRCPVGEARITGAGRLSARFVIHTVGPIYHATANPDILLASAYRESLKLAQMNQCRSLALPAVSCGVYGYPADEAARVALNVCRRDEYAELDLHFYLFDADMLFTWQHALHAQ